MGIKFRKFVSLALVSASLMTIAAGCKEAPPADSIVGILAEATRIGEWGRGEVPDTIDTDAFYEALRELYGLKIYSARTDIPHYFQTDYDHVEFSDGTIATDGCGITCLSMIASYLLDEEILPDEMAFRYDCGANPAAAMEWGIRDMELNCEKYYGDVIHEHVWGAIDEGRPVIALMQTGSLFTDYGHFIVIAGMTEDGKYIVNDPSKKNYRKERLIEGYRSGFTKEELSWGLNGVYIFDKKEGEDKEESVLDIYADVMDSLNRSTK